MPTGLHRTSASRSAVQLVPGQWAQADAVIRVIEGPGDPRNCEPLPSYLGIDIAGRRLVAPMPPFPVCQHGRIQLAALRAVPAAPLCASNQLSARYYELGDGKSDDGSDEYTLVLINNEGACSLNGNPRLRLLGVTGRPLPTRVDPAIPVPIVIAAHGTISSLATMFFERMPGTFGPADCDARATSIRITLLGTGGSIETKVRSPLRPCYHGTIGDLGFVQGQQFV
jgi:hypothetical protein